MADWAWFGKLHLATYRATNGFIGGNLAGRQMLLLTTKGRKSGEQRTTPLSFFRDGDDCVVVASNNGGPRHPAWWLNLSADARGEVQVRGEVWKIEAHAAGAEEEARLWPLLVAYNPPYQVYRDRTEREIPVVVLRRAS